MRVKTIVDEDFVNYRKPSMFIGTVSCGGKCCVEAGLPLNVCQNDVWRESAAVVVNDAELCRRYLSNPITSAMVFGGLEPLEQQDEVLSLIKTLRRDFACADDMVIYTGYYPNEVKEFLCHVSEFENIVVKFGRFVPDRPHRFDEVLGVTLASDNQWAVKIT